MNHKFGDIIRRYGVTEEAYRNCIPQILKSNRLLLLVFNSAMAVFFLLLSVVDPDVTYRALRLLVSGVSLANYLLLRRRPFRNVVEMRLNLHVTMLLMLLATGYQSLAFKPEMYCTSFLLALAAFPVLLLDRPTSVMAVSGLVGLAYLVAAWHRKLPTVAYGDTINVLLALTAGAVGQYTQGHSRIRGILDRVELRARDKRNEEVMDNTPVGLCRMQMNGKQLKLTYFNSTFLEICRMDEAAVRRLCADSAYNILHPDDRAWVRDEMENPAGENTPFTVKDFRLLTGAGQPVWVSATMSLRVMSDGTRSFYVVCKDVTDEHALRSALDNAQKRFEIALDNSDLQIWEYDLVNRRCLCPDKMMRTYGIPRVTEDFPDCLADSGHIDDRSISVLLAMKRQLMAGEPTVQGDLRIRDANGKWHWRRAVYKLETDEKGSPLRAIGCSREVTEQHRMEQKFADQLAYRNSVAKNSLFSMRADLDDNIIFEHTSSEPRLEACCLPGMAASDLLAAFLANAADEMEAGSACRCMTLPALRRAFDEGEIRLQARYRCRLLRIYVNLEVSLLRNPMTGHREAFFVYTDVNDICMTQKALAAVVNTSYSFAGIVDTETKQFFCMVHRNEDSAPVHYYEDYDTAVQQVSDNAQIRYLTEEDRLAACENVRLQNVVAQLETERRYEFNLRLKEGDGISTYRLSYCYIDEHKTKILVVQSDVTQALRDEENHRQMLADALHAAEQASRAKSEFLSRMSHEIRTPMNAIIGISSLAVNDVNDPVMMGEDLSKIMMSARYLLSLINDILDMSRIESGRMSLNIAPIAFDEFVGGVNNIIYSQCAAKGVDYDVIVNGFVETAYLGDRVKLQQVLVNILGNAVKFTPKGGKITMMIEQLSVSAGRAALRFTISDTGIGMDEEFIPHLFTPFEQENTGTTTSYGGTGLGLAISKNMVEMMDGHIDVHSIKGVGSEFVVEVKLGISEEAARLAALQTQLQLPELNTLVVDDDVLVCQNAENILHKMGLRSEWAGSGVAAVELVRQHHSAGDDYNLILLDWKMPGMDGIETAREIRKVVGDDVTIIIMTAYDWSQIEKTARAAGVNMFMQKPIFQTTLLSAFRKIYGAAVETVVPPKTEYHLTGKHILLVDDHPLNTEIARRILKAKGITVTEAKNGLEAIERFTEAPAGSFDAILMDVRMPVMDGLTAAAHIRRLNKEGSKTIPIIAMTANAFEEDVKKSRDSGMDAHLAKPIDPELLYATLERFLADGPQES